MGTQDRSGAGEYPGDDFIIAMGIFPDQTGTQLAQAGTFMHELGHNLFLHHGGDEDVNYKPNYRSVLNYRFQFFGIDSDCDVLPNGIVDYSAEALVSLDERALQCINDPEINCLDEDIGVCDGRPIDWNGDGDVDDTQLRLDVNNDGALTVLHGWNDWESLVLSMSPAGGGGGTIERVACKSINDP